ncbi:MAG: hypothetical protein ACJAYN_002151 [Bermanella sp.]|jgi:hypothetical protein
MFKRNHINVAIAATALLTSSAAFAETVTSTASVTVQNAFTLAEVAPLNFGALRVTQGAAQDPVLPAFITLPVDGSAMVPTGGQTNGGTASTDANMTAITQGSIAEYAISNAAPFTNLTVTVASGASATAASGIAGTITGVNGATMVTAGGGTNESFIIYATVADTLIVGGANDGIALNATASNLRTDAAGTVGLQLGGVLAFNPLAATSPNDGVYNGSYTLEVAY